MYLHVYLRTYLVHTVCCTFYWYWGLFGVYDCCGDLSCSQFSSDLQLILQSRQWTRRSLGPVLDTVRLYRTLVCRTLIVSHVLIVLLWLTMNLFHVGVRRPPVRVGVTEASGRVSGGTGAGPPFLWFRLLLSGLRPALIRIQF